ncbi:phosphotyrosine protein phosphatase [Halomonas cupida]|uniref:protein-tyrosine-phosphatase n=1 Tax=Halomonas cupida TaxID=44933 RepID=A0A1M7A3Q7_9GAMM|nr:low molecular weight protein-tyrosine-phosphatase [Halomonas cupida]GEN22548.1 phosphotyrosine protein phosphatase [Halomonas cupida]SHL37265.1 protein tyrosine phosphatase [Halomonas cupida]
MRVLFVCLGNICRSPTAEGIVRARLRAAGLESVVELDSCGTGPWHVGEAPDARAQQAAAQRGIDLSALRGRQLQDADFMRFDYLLAMDHSNLSVLESRRPAASEAHVGLLMDFAGEPGEQVPDPYYEGGFDRVYDMIERAADGLVVELQDQLQDRLQHQSPQRPETHR